MAEVIDYTTLLPAAPDADLAAWAVEQGAFPEELLVYRADWSTDPLTGEKSQLAHVFCSACGEDFFADKINAGSCCNAYATAPFGWKNFGPEESVISGDQTLCPLCGNEAKTIHIGNGIAVRTQEVFVTTFMRVEPNGVTPRLALVERVVRQEINRDGEKIRSVFPWSAWVVEERKIIRLCGYIRYMTSCSLLGRWEQRKKFDDTYGKYTLLYPWDPALLEGTTAENCKLDRYIRDGGVWLVAYLALWRKRPAVENLVVQGCGKLVDDMILAEDSVHYSYTSRHHGIPKLPGVNWKEKRPAQMLRLNKDEFRELQRGKWTAGQLSKYLLARDAGITIRLPEDAKLLFRLEEYNLNRILEEAPHSDFWRILRYLDRQKEKDFSQLRDYWRMARDLDWDLTDNLVHWPRSLKTAHDRAVAEIRFQQKKEEIRKLAAGFRKRKKELARFSFEADGLLIRPCANQQELIREGAELHHCVGMYAESHSSGKTSIFFIRKSEDPDTPFFTLEFDVDARKVIQNRGLRNCARTPEVEAFEKLWLDWVRDGCSSGQRQEVRIPA